MEVKQYRIEIRTSATLIYYVSEYDIHTAIGLALEAPYSEWQVSEFDMPADSDVIAEETRL
jgi:hypothetical protein